MAARARCSIGVAGQQVARIRIGSHGSTPIGAPQCITEQCGDRRYRKRASIRQHERVQEPQGAFSAW